MVGKLYSKGDCWLVADQCKAYEWFRRAAIQHDAEGLYHTAHAYQHGIGTISSDEEAFRNYSAAAQKEHVDAMHCLAMCYQNMCGTPKAPIRMHAFHARTHAHHMHSRTQACNLAGPEEGVQVASVSGRR